ncbi:MAG TPA: iron-containing alcohol dehydrogenase [Pseudoflavonifractor sp.]|nr:iron-containing alcohol dehydrogenase [Pseudoflavonifractor sp.]
MEHRFTYLQTCPVYFGEGSAAEAGAKMQALGCRSVLLVCDKNGAKFGLADRVRAGFRDTGITLVQFDDVSPDPADTMVDHCARIARDACLEGVVGVGGGSVLDTAKAVSVLLRNEGSVRDHMKPNLPPNPGAPLILIPTTAGTGSEVTNVGVITHTGKNLKIGVECQATLAILDPTLTYSVPPEVTAETAMDALAHAAECVTGTVANPHADTLALEAIRTILDCLPRAVADGGDAEARRGLCLASSLAGIAFSETMVHVGHAMSQGMGARLHISHGAGCALCLPAALEYTAPAVPGQLAKVAAALGLGVEEGTAPEGLGRRVADFLCAFMDRVGIRSLRERGFTREAVVACAEAAMEDFLVDYCPTPVTLENVREMYRRIYGYERKGTDNP